jgi:predicted phosphodiesterase
MAKESVRIMHLSDIHFYESSDGSTHKYRHDINCLKKIRTLVDTHEPNYLVITGDITNIGDKLSLERAYQWIHDRIYVDGEYFGLEATKKGIVPIIVPGNHDAFNAPTHGSNYHRWQTSLANYYSAFHEYRFGDKATSVDYVWIASGDIRVFVCRVDSCFLGDPETEAYSSGLSLDKVAKGKISRIQSEEILSLYDKGIRGELLDGQGKPITPGDFLRSLKILVTHHYLFEPADARAEPLLALNDKKAVFQNIAMSDFDVLLCGHKHIADIHVYSYLDHFDARGKVRLALNHVRRSLGIKSLPLRADDDGRLLARMYRFMLGVLYLSKTQGKGLTEEHAEEIITILQRSLESPLVLKDELGRYIRQKRDVLQAGLFEDDEIRDLHSRIQKQFSQADQRKIILAAGSLRGTISKLGGRPFAHIISGSSAKFSETNSRARAVNMYQVEGSGTSDYSLSIERFSWDAEGRAVDGTKGNFGRPISQNIVFSHERLNASGA